MDEVEVTVERLVAGGEGLGREGSGRIVFVRGAAAGEVVRVALTEERRDHARGAITEILQPSPSRVVPPCPRVADGCGGCDWQHLEVGAQRTARLGLVADALRRAARVDLDIALGPAVPHEAYRTTVRLAVDGGPGAGYRKWHSHELAITDRCLISHPRINELLAAASFRGSGEVVVRVSAASGDGLLVVDPGVEVDVALPGYTVVPADDPGDAHLVEVVAGHELRVSARSFFQPGASGAAALAEVVRSEVASGPPGSLTDLYGGVGLFAVTASGDRLVTLVEAARPAVRDATANLAGRPARITRRRVEAWIPQPATVVVADPPREGLGRAGVDAVSATGAELLALVSCDAAAFARDAALLQAGGYRLVRGTLVDQFGHTSHVEVVSRFERR